jgi:hypothetical protein
MLLNDVLDELGTVDDFVGHVGGDDFLMVTEKGLVDDFRKEIVKRFDEKVGTHYDFMTRSQGYLVTKDDSGNEVQVPLMSLRIGILTSEDGPFTDIREITEIAAEVRRQSGSGK